jgi:hypothetical protein
MDYRIVIYIQPWEIDDLERIIHHLILSSYYIDKTDTVILDVTMNTSTILVDWNNSTVDKNYFSNKFLYLNSVASQYFETEFDTDVNVQGCVDKRRLANTKSHDYIIWLDPDVFFSIYTLPYLIQSTKQITNSNFVLSPQIIKYWDNSWDCLTYHEFLTQPTNHRDYFDMYSLDSIVSDTSKQLIVNSQVKFGGGWFNLFPSSLFEIIPIPDEFGSYGWEDLYIMMCCEMLKIPQYVIQGVIVSEIGKMLQTNKDYYKPFISINQTSYNKISNKQFDDIVTKFFNERLK